MKVGIPPQVFVMGTLIFVIGVAFAIAAWFTARRGDASLRPTAEANAQDEYATA